MNINGNLLRWQGDTDEEQCLVDDLSLSSRTVGRLVGCSYKKVLIKRKEMAR